MDGFSDFLSNFPGVAPLSPQDGDQESASEPTGNFWGDALSSGYGLTMSALSEINDPGFQSFLISVDRLLRPNQYNPDGTPRLPAASISGPGSILDKAVAFRYGIARRTTIRGRRLASGAWVVHPFDAADYVLAHPAPGTIGGVTPDFGRLSIPEAEAVLEGLVARNLLQLDQGERPISVGIAQGLVRWKAEPAGVEQWRSIRDIWRLGKADCEDLAAAIAAEFRRQGIMAKVRIRPPRAGSNVAHAVVELPDGSILDPSIDAGMPAAA